ncbi:6-hydroxymethylpterin diphosphokinase MptE-like protein [Turneriella parva]|uniref:6-hydroxymethylpterin diphosphokinase MptE-like domain-containing protein n=1 Tax=Turneriella parva (strain ATCC BAA-1111 / DSM 21527 / NCTC 11395 / H) TaxID=869212 RepID=I4B5K4_TURPD|nr:6-hydroxymethylpterin diphosphokinase MptE-like protein [Turneriella parva]AFM12561.1 hypothetical protein Turpa_1914 [Turneriella parva DSM 21527]
MSLSPFSAFEAVVSAERQQIRFAEQTITFYTARSGERDLRHFREQLAAVSPSMIPLLVAPYSTSLAPLLKDARRFVWLAPVCFSKNLPGDARLICSDANLQEFINSVETDDNFEIVIPPQWQGFQAAVRTVTVEILRQAAARLKTLRHFGRLWPINFTANAPSARRWRDIRTLAAGGAPDAIVMAGPTLDQSLRELQSKQNIWAADTALPVLSAHGIEARAVFSADAGFASREHFVGVNTTKATLVCDMLVNPGVARLPFAAICTYASSHPLVQQFCLVERPDLTAITNAEGNVGSLMLAIHQDLFGELPVSIYGYDRGHRRRVTHARGTAYFRRVYGRQTRIANIETYMLRLSRRYS